MIILTIRTDKPEAELGLYNSHELISGINWQAHRSLSSTLHTRIDGLLSSHGKKLEELDGVACFKGPGSFTGLRIGLSVANAIAYSLDIPIVAVAGDNWRKHAIAELLNGKNQRIAIPEYGQAALTSLPRK